MSGCTSNHPDVLFHTLNSKISINDNLDLIEPDYILVNEYFTDPSVVDNIKKVTSNVSIINIPYIIPNEFGKIDQVMSNNCIACIIANTNIKKDKVYKKNRYYRMFSIFEPIDHIQHYGVITSCKDLSTIIWSHDEIVIDQPIFSSLCNFYKKNYSYMQNDITTNVCDYKTNKDVLYAILK